MAPSTDTRGGAQVSRGGSTAAPAARGRGGRKKAPVDKEEKEDGEQWVYNNTEQLDAKVPPTMFPGRTDESTTLPHTAPKDLWTNKPDWWTKYSLKQIRLDADDPRDEYSMLIDHDPNQEIKIPEPANITAREREEVAAFRRFRRHVHEGPLYTVMGDSARVTKTTQKKGRVQNPFEDMPSYTQKYKQTVRTLPEFDPKDFCLSMFPEELWDTIDPSLRSKKPQPKLVKRTGSAALLNGSKAVNDDDDNEAANDDDLVNPDEDDVAEEEDPDENFEEGDSDMGGDYDAEQYFDGGDEDGEDGGGDDGGGDDFD